MNLTNFDEAKQYFQDLAGSHVDIASFHYGDQEILQSASRSNLKLPVLWLEPYQPVVVQDNFSDNHLGLVTTTVAIYTKSESEKYEDVDDAYSKCEAIIKDIISKLIKDYNEGEIVISLNGFKYGQAEDLMGATRLIGCRLDISYYRPERFVYDENKWQ